MLSIIIPAHDEALVVGRLLRGLLSSAEEGEFDIFVVANGCTDDTAEVAASFGPQIRVLSIPVASKREALAAGDREATSFPRLYVDADVELRTDDARELHRALQRPGILGASPERTFVIKGRPWPIRWYYDVWGRLPEVRQGLFGRGVFGVSEAGYARITAMPAGLTDDLAASLAFAPDERLILPSAGVIIHPPRTFADLLRVRTRVAMGVSQVKHTMDRSVLTLQTRPSDLLAVACRDIRMAPRVALFLWVALLARVEAHRMVAHGRGSEWLRDESSRIGIVPDGC